MKRDSSYLCIACNKVRKISIDVAEHENNVRNSQNGLGIYSDIHNCYEGILSINNVHIDAEYHVRSFSLLELPNKRKLPKSIPGLPLPKTQNVGLNYYQITQISEKGTIRIILIDKQLNVKINIGNVIEGEEVRIALIESDLGTVELHFYPSNIPYRSNPEKWLTTFVNALELLPPTKLGLLIEALRYVQSHILQKPTPFEIEQLHTILTTHETYFKLKHIKGRYKRIKDISSKYGEEVKENVKKILGYLDKQPEASLQEVVQTVNINLIYVIYLLLILENEDIISIDRPKISE